MSALGSIFPVCEIQIKMLLLQKTQRIQNNHSIRIIQPNTVKSILQFSLVLPVGILFPSLDNDVVTWRTLKGINKNLLTLIFRRKGNDLSVSAYFWVMSWIIVHARSVLFHFMPLSSTITPTDSKQL